MDMADIAARLLHPAVQALLLGVCCVVLLWLRRERAALCAALLAAGWITLASMPAFALRVHRSLVGSAPVAITSADAIVVLGGGRLPVHDWSDTSTRAGRGLQLWQQRRAPVLLVSGSDQAFRLARGFVAAGVPIRDLRIEPTSINTHENAQHSAAILAAEGLTHVVLVTSAIHMQRAAGCFRREGVEVTPAPVDEEADRLRSAPVLMPDRDALSLTARCLRELLARWIYRRRGWM